jgi:ribosomal RNA-processing protein 9
MGKDTFLVKPRKRQRDEELESDIDSDIDNDNSEQFQVDEETAQEKRIRLAKAYIAKTKAELENDDVDAEEIDQELIRSRLKDDILEQQGRLKKELADSLVIGEGLVLRTKGIATCAEITPDARFVYCAGKDGVVVKYNLNERKRVAEFARVQKDKDGHYDQILCMAVSSDGKYLATGGKDKRLCVWSVEDDKLIRMFTQHRDEVTGVCFQKGKNILYSGSADRTVKVFSMDEMTYVETLFGHQASITGMHEMGRKDRCLSTGGRDRTVRLWKIVEESQLVFRASSAKQSKRDSTPLGLDETGSVDVVACLNDELWLTGSDGGSISVWSIQRKKPVVTVPNAHGRIFKKVSSQDNDVKEEEEEEEEEEETTRYIDDDNRSELPTEGEWTSSACWITALATVPFSDLVASGSSDGSIRLWKISEEGRSLSLLKKLKVEGFINSLRFSPSGKQLVAAVGQEHKNGRWSRIKNARNGVFLVNIQ